MKHKAKKERKAAKRIERTGVLSELNLTEVEILMAAKILSFFILRAKGEFFRDATFMDFDDHYTDMDRDQLSKLVDKFRRMAAYLKEIHDKTPEEIAKLNMNRQEAREAVAVAAKASSEAGPVLPGLTELVEEALANADSIR